MSSSAHTSSPLSPMRLLEMAAAFLLCATAAATPWLLGANTVSRTPVLLILSLSFITSFGLLFTARICRKQFPAIPRTVLYAAGFLIGCLLYWATRTAPDFATVFARRHWQFMQDRTPASLLDFSHTSTLLWYFSLILAVCTAIDLGRHTVVRKSLLLAMSLSGLAAAAWSFAQAHFHWPAPVWLLTASGLDSYAGPFFHHGIAAISFNFAWPLLLFLLPHKKTTPLLVIVFLVLACTWLFPLWHTSSATAIALGLAVLGCCVLWLPHFPRFAGEMQSRVQSRELRARSSENAVEVVGLIDRFTVWSGSGLSTLSSGLHRAIQARRPLLTVVTLTFSVILLWQLISLRTLRHDHPDGWHSAALSLEESTYFNNTVEAAALLRGDHLVVSTAPARPVAWLTAWRMAADHPLLGPGPGSWKTHAVLYSNEPVIHTFFQHRQFAHHDFLQFAAECGWLPALTLAALWLTALVKCILNLDTLKATSGELGLILASLGLTLSSCLYFPLHVPALQCWAALALGLLWSTKDRRIKD